MVKFYKNVKCSSLQMFNVWLLNIIVTKKKIMVNI